MSKHGMVMDGLADAALESVFCGEWIKLDSPGRRAVMDDFLDASEAESLSASEYRDRIGRGNLASYADCLLVKAPGESKCISGLSIDDG